MRKPTFKHVAYASATASIIFTMAGPALANSNTEDTAGRQRSSVQRDVGTREAAKAFESALEEAKTARLAAYAEAKTLTDVAAAKAMRQAADRDYRLARNEAKKALKTAHRLIKHWTVE